MANQIHNTLVMHYAIQIFDNHRPIAMSALAEEIGITPAEFNRWANQQECPNLRRMILRCYMLLGMKSPGELLVTRHEAEGQIVIANRLDALLGDYVPFWTRREAIQQLGISRNTFYRWLKQEEEKPCYRQMAAIMTYFGMDSVDDLYVIERE